MPDPREPHTVVDVSQPVAVDCQDDLGTTHVVDTVFSYDRRDPWAVTITFLTATGEQPWTFARDLLVHGRHTPTGDGDVHVWPMRSPEGTSLVCFELRSPDGELVGRVSAGDVHWFLAATMSVVPTGSEHEHLDVDALTARLLTD